MYYLQSRYYDPEVGRFLNADAYTSTGQGILGNNMFAYCNNNPVNLKDINGENPIPVIITLTTSGAVAGIIICGVAIVFLTWQILAEVLNWLDEQWFADLLTVEFASSDPVPDVTYPGDDPQKAPDGSEWRGTGEPGSKGGNYYNPDTGESWHPDLDHPDPVGPHWDYSYRGMIGNGWRVYSDGRVVAKVLAAIFLTAFGLDNDEVE